MNWQRTVALAAAWALLLAGCVPAASGRSDLTAPTQSPAPTVTVTELPAGLGRGLPRAELDQPTARASSLNVGDPAPDFQLVLADGRILRLSDLRGRPVLLNFWASWCGPCRLEMPDILAAQAAYEGELVVLAVNAQESLSAVEPFVAEFQMEIPVVVDETGLLMRLYQVRTMPTSYFIDAEGQIAVKWSGMMTAELIDELLRRIL